MPIEWMQYGTYHVVHIGRFTLEVSEVPIKEDDGAVRNQFFWTTTDHLERNPYGLKSVTGAEATLAEAQKEAELGMEDILNF